LCSFVETAGAFKHSMRRQWPSVAT
jgi:hypothetical protein